MGMSSSVAVGQGRRRSPPKFESQDGRGCTGSRQNDQRHNEPWSLKKEVVKHFLKKELCEYLRHRHLYN